MRKNVFSSACILGIAALLLMPSAASADDDPKVSQWFADSALSYVTEQQAQNVRTDEDPVPYARATGVSDPAEIYAWSDAFVRGDAVKYPVESTGEWQAALLEGDTPVGVVIAAYDPAGGTVQPTGYGEDPDIAHAVTTLTEGATLVLDAPSSGLYELRDGMVTGLNAPAKVEAPKPISVSDFQVVITTRYAQSIAESERYDGDAVGGGGPLAPTADVGAQAWGLATAAAGVGLISAGVILWVRRKSASHAG